MKKVQRTVWLPISSFFSWYCFSFPSCDFPTSAKIELVSCIYTDFPLCFLFVYLKERVFYTWYCEVIWSCGPKEQLKVNAFEWTYTFSVKLKIIYSLFIFNFKKPRIKQPKHKPKNSMETQDLSSKELEEKKTFRIFLQKFTAIMTLEKKWKSTKHIWKRQSINYNEFKYMLM